MPVVEEAVAKQGFNILLPFGGFWKSIIVYLLIIIMIHATIHVFQQRSARPYLDEVMPYFIGADAGLLHQVAIQKTDTTNYFAPYIAKNPLDAVWHPFALFLHFVYQWFAILSLLFFIIVNIKIWSWILTFAFGTEVSKFWIYVWAIFIIFIMSGWFTAYAFQGHAFYVPFGGVFSLITYVFHAGNPLYEGAYRFVTTHNIPFAELPKPIYNSSGV